MHASNRTFICSVVFLDIVEYSKKPVGEQIALKERLNGLLAEALANVAPNDRIILDTGDGAALSFLGDPEDALFVSLSLRDALATVQPAPGPEMKMRVGINLGPVKLIKDLNGQPNIIGDGINVAQRVMTFAEPGQILVSRSYYEVVSCLSDEYVQLFHYEGARTDKHVREHEVYAVQATSSSLRAASAAALPVPVPAAPARRPVVIDQLSQSASFVTEQLRRKPRLGTALAVVAILATAVVIRVNRAPPPAPVAAPAAPPVEVAAAPDAADKPAPAPQKPAAAPGKPAPGAPTASAPPRVAEAPTPAAPVPPRVAEAPKPAAPGEPGSINFTVLPWGEIYVNGKLMGVTPPLRNVELAPGRHRVEIRNAHLPPHVEVVDVKPGSRIRIRHRFQQ